MKYIAALVVIICWNNAQSEIKSLQNSKTKQDSTITPDKDAIASMLIVLRDSIDNSVIALQKKREANKANYYADPFDNAYSRLTAQRREIEKVIEEVVDSGEQTWDENIRKRALNQIAERRRDYYQTLQTLSAY